LVSERDRLNKDLEEQHAQIKAMEAELEHMYQLHGRGTIRR
jgi:cell division control protein 12